MGRDAQVGISQRIRLEWLEYATGLMVRGYSREQIIDSLDTLLRDRVSAGGTGERTNRDKTLTILMRTWVTVPPHLVALRDDGLRLMERLPEGDHLLIHWGMTMAAYPFWGAVADTVGRLLRLQGVVPAAQVQRRMREQLGERETVSRATRRALRSFIDWSVLQETAQKGLYQRGTQREVRNRDTLAWLVESVLLSRGVTSSPARDLMASPSLFPFAIDPSLSLIELKSDRLEGLHQGLDEDVVVLLAQASTGISRKL